MTATKATEQGATLQVPVYSDADDVLGYWQQIVEDCGTVQSTACIGQFNHLRVIGQV